MNNFKKKTGFGGSSFKRAGRSDDRGWGGNAREDKEMFEATCADCKKICEVPFKPNGKKPVYCKDCFAKNGGQTEPREFKKEFQKKNYGPQNDDKKLDELARQLASLNTKFDKLISLTEELVENSK